LAIFQFIDEKVVNAENNIVAAMAIGKNNFFMF